MTTQTILSAANEQYLRRLTIDLQLRGLAQNTQRSYLLNVRAFLNFCGKDATLLDETDVRAYLVQQMRSNTLCNASINLHNASIRFFFATTLNRTMNYLQMPRFKQRKTLPELLTREETERLIDECANLKHKSWFMLAYGSGLRISEIAALRVCDIDSKSMRIFVRDGKGGKDRYTLLSHECLCVLREYWSVQRPGKGTAWLFPGIAKSPNHVSPNSIGDAFIGEKKKLKITKSVSMHSLRHGFATHLLEDGAALLQIKELLGHASLSSTQVYLHLADTAAGVVSPADRRCRDES
jgi:site-specific recombinase XerD